MTKTKVTRHAVAMSFLSLMLCVSMLLGTTFAWFTDSVTSAGNIIKSGTLDVEMYYANGTEAVPADGDAAWNDASTGAIFNYDLWEPGYTEVRHIQIKNVGTLALKYKVQIVANGTVSNLADVIDVYYMDPAEQVASRSDLAAKTPMGTLTEALAGMDTTAAGNLLAGQAHTITVALKMQEEAGNEYQNKSIGTDFSIQLIATQLTSEVDSFDELYDETSVFPVLSVAKTAAISSNTTSEDLTIAKTGEIESATVPAAAANTLFDSMKDDEAESNELTLTLNVAKTGETTTSAGTTVALEIDMTAVMESTKAGVTSTTTDNVTTFSNYITIEYNLGAGLSGVTATHKGNAMVNSTDTADDAGHGIYSYDAESGILTIKTKTLSPFAVSYDLTAAQKAEVDGLTVVDTGSYGAVAKDASGILYWYQTNGDIYLDDMSDYEGTSFTIPETVDGIAQSAFAGNTTIKTLTLTHNVAAYKALAGNSTINTVIFDGMTAIPNRMFYGCTGITQLVIPEGVTRIEDFAFYGNTAIEEVTVAESIEYIGYKAFDACSALRVLDIKGSPAIMSWAARQVAAIEEIYIRGENATVDLTYAPAGNNAGGFVFCKTQQSGNPNTMAGVNMYFANETVANYFNAEIGTMGATVNYLD